jgi:hypothetical protein
VSEHPAARFLSVASEFMFCYEKYQTVKPPGEAAAREARR